MILKKSLHSWGRDYNTIIPWLLSAERDNARTEGEGEHGTKLS